MPPSLVHRGFPTGDIVQHVPL
uniref:Uncharacterized protein n=1 Tax=Anguilla anguilla TaxID=7936 RepID=A0A0E9QZ35_ANGAN